MLFSDTVKAKAVKPEFLNYVQLDYLKIYFPIILITNKTKEKTI
jgi:hypothetical protein